MGLTIVALAVSSGCGSDAVTGSSSTTTSGSGGSGGSGGDATTTTSSGGGQGGQGGGQGGGGQGGAGGGGMCPSLGDACTTCLSVQCQDTYCTCFQNSECGALAFCLQNCSVNDQACIQTCLGMHPTGISDAFLVANCTAASCDMECPGANALGPCEQCLFTSCSSEMNTCLANPDCYAIIDCAQQQMCAPSDIQCVSACAAGHQAGVQDATAVAMCGQNNCTADCQ